MEADRSSRTAEYVAAMRASHCIHHSPLIFEDPCAIDLIGPELRDLVRSGQLQADCERPGMPCIQGQVLGRARCIEDKLAEVLPTVGQYAIVGAGLDSFVLRHRAWLERLEVYELDHPATQETKRERLADAGFRPHPGVRFAPVDFENESLGEALERTPFRRDRPSFFAWQGVVAYLSKDAVLSTLEAIARCAAIDSHVVFDYPVEPGRLSPAELELVRMVRSGTAAMGEPRRATHDPDQLHARVRSLGWRVVEDLSASDLEQRYFRGRRDGLRAYPEIRIAHLQRAPAPPD